MKKLIKILWILSVLSLVGCTTVYFDNGPERENEKRNEAFSNWHHDIIFGLVEVSDPVNLKQVCENHDWSTVRVEQDVPQSIITLLIGWAYSPWDVRYSCDASDNQTAPATKMKKKNSKPKA